MKSLFICEKCDAQFQTEQECINHEKDCNPMITYICDKCGKTESYKPDEHISSYWFSIDLGTPDYRSKELDNKIVKFDLCDSCMYQFINTFKYKDNILNSNEEQWDERYKLDTNISEELFDGLKLIK